MKPTRHEPPDVEPCDEDLTKQKRRRVLSIQPVSSVRTVWVEKEEALLIHRGSECIVMFLSFRLRMRTHDTQTQRVCV